MEVYFIIHGCCSGMTTAANLRLNWNLFQLDCKIIQLDFSLETYVLNWSCTVFSSNGAT